MSEPVVVAQGLSVGHGGRACLSGLCLTLIPGSVTAVLGPNGAGKSTLLGTILGAYEPLAGWVTIDGDPPNALTAREMARRASYVPQTEPAIHGLTVFETLMLGRASRWSGIRDTPEDIAAVKRAADAVALTELLSRPLAKVSAGERQRALIGRALVQNAPLMVLDEPTANLDPGHHGSIGSMLRRLATEGRTILVATHDIFWASAFSGHAIIVGDGRALATGSTPQLMATQALEEAYGCRFIRVETPSGNVPVPDYLTETRF